MKLCVQNQNIIVVIVNIICNTIVHEYWIVQKIIIYWLEYEK